MGGSRGHVVHRCGCGTNVKCSNSKHRGSWYFVADVGPDPETRKRKQVSRGGFRTKDDAQKELTKLLASVDNGTWTDDAGRTVAQWLDEWLEAIEAGGRKASTLVGYRSHAELYLKPHLGHRRLRDLRRGHVETMLRKVDAGTEVKRGKGAGRGGRHRGKPGPATLDSVRRTLRAALTSALRRQYVAVNVAAGEMDALPSIRRAEVKPWEVAELGAFLDHVDADRLAALYEVAAFAGLRRGELCGLRWEDVDLEKALLTVRQEIVGLAGLHNCPVCGSTHRGIWFDTTKTEASAAIVPLVGGTVGALIAHQVAQAAEQEAWGEAYVDHGLVFCREDGQPLRPDYVTKAHADHAAAAGLRKIHLHDMRHGAATLLLASGSNLVVVSKILRHSSPTVTADVYAHALESGTRAAVESAAALVPRRLREQSVSSPGESADNRPKEEP